MEGHLKKEQSSKAKKKEGQAQRNVMTSCDSWRQTALKQPSALSSEVIVYKFFIFIFVGWVEECSWIILAVSWNLLLALC